MSNNYWIVKRCGYCGADFTEWHECAGTERERHSYGQEKTTKEAEALTELLNRTPSTKP